MVSKYVFQLTYTEDKEYVNLFCQKQKYIHREITFMNSRILC